MSEKSKLDELKAKVAELTAAMSKIEDELDLANDELQNELIKEANLIPIGTEIVLHGVVVAHDPFDQGRELKIDLLDGRVCGVWVANNLPKVKDSNG